MILHHPCRIVVSTNPFRGNLLVGFVFKEFAPKGAWCLA
jgi:hypothetical protein